MIARAVSAVHARTVFGRRVRAIAHHVAELVPSEARTMLDVGCGDGTLARTVAERRGLTVEGAEILARPITAIPVTVYDGLTLPCADQSYDVVLMVDMLHHALHPRRLLREAARVARLGVIVKDHLTDPWLGAQRLSAMDWVGNVGHGVPLLDAYWSRAEWCGAFADAGLRETTRRESLGLYPAPMRWAFEDGLHFVTMLAHA